MLSGPGAHPMILPQFLSLLRRTGGTPNERIHRALDVMREELDMSFATISRFAEGRRVLTHVSGIDVAPEAWVMPAEETLCHLVASGAVGPLTPDVTRSPTFAGHPHVSLFDVGAYVGAPLRTAGAVVGAVCAGAHSARPDLSERDAARIHTIATYVAEVLAEQQSGAGTGHDLALGSAAALIAEGNDLEAMTRPILQILQDLTGLESTYLTMIDWAGNEQRIAYSRNTGQMDLPEGLRVDWSDTLCRRSLQEGRPYTRDVPDVWGDSAGGAALGIQTYLGVPVLDGGDGVVGTLCGASQQSLDLDERSIAAMRVFAQLLSAQLQRDAARSAAQERELQREARVPAARDSRTGLVNRAAVHSWLEAILPGVRAGTEQVAVAWVRLPGASDDDAADAVADVFGQVLRAGDLRGRIGNAFVTASVLPATQASLGTWRERLTLSLAAAISPPPLIGVHATDDPRRTADDVLATARENLLSTTRA